MNNKVVLIGCGNVGMAYAYALVNQKVYVDNLVLIDINKDKALGEAMDLNHCQAYSPSKIKITVGDYSDCKGAKIVVIVFNVLILLTYKIVFIVEIVHFVMTVKDA